MWGLVKSKRDILNVVKRRLWGLNKQIIDCPEAIYLSSLEDELKDIANWIRENRGIIRDE